MSTNLPIAGDQSGDHWSAHYSTRAAGWTVSDVRALFAVASRPDVVSLAGGMPFVSALPQDVVQDAVSRVLREQGAAALQYGSGQGVLKLREQILEVMELEGIQASADNVMVTTGSQHALDLVTELLIDPGDAILVEAPSYVGAIGVFRSHRASVVHVDVDDDGLDPGDLRAKIQATRAAGHRIKFLYTIPNFQNPAGVTLSPARRSEVLEICRANDILVLEDNPYGLLYFDRPPPASLRSLDDSGVIYLGTFSKTLAPGFRVGWVLAPRAIRERLVLANEASILCPSSFSQLVISEYLASADWKAQINTFRGIYRERKLATVNALAEYLPNLRWTDPNGGFYVWATLPEGLDSKALLPSALEAKVAYTPGTAFFADGDGHSNLRLSFCYPPAEEIREGVRRLSTVIPA